MTDLESPGSPDLNSSNRPVRTRMPGGVGGAAAQIAVPPIPIGNGHATGQRGQVWRPFREIKGIRIVAPLIVPLVMQTHGGEMASATEPTSICSHA